MKTLQRRLRRSDVRLTCLMNITYLLTYLAYLLVKLGLGQLFSVQRVGVELTVSRVRTDRPCGSCANRILSHFGCHVICNWELLGGSFPCST